MFKKPCVFRALYADFRRFRLANYTIYNNSVQKSVRDEKNLVSLDQFQRHFVLVILNFYPN